MALPVATSTGANTAQLESFVLSQPGIPSDLAQEIRLLGNLQTTLPVPTPPGAAESSVVVNGQPAVLLAEEMCIRDREYSPVRSRFTTILQLRRGSRIGIERIRSLTADLCCQCVDLIS